jgi:hypothetical protein
MGYGFDLQEWVTEDEVGVWAKYMHDHMGWRHLLSARGRSHSELDIRSFSYLKHPYSDAVQNLDEEPHRPQFFEERDLFERSGATMDWTRQHLWKYTLAGGHAGFWGNFWSNNDKPYTHPEQLRTHHRFWMENKRFLLDMQRDNGLTNNGYVLTDPGKDHYIFYKEGTDSIQLDLSGMTAAHDAIAVDTKLEYAEIDLGKLNPVNNTWNAPYTSDWAIAVGTFEGTSTDPSAPIIIQHPTDVEVDEGQVAQFTVLVSGNPPPTFQWRKNGVNIPAATSSVYGFPAALSNDGAAFQVYVSNSEGNVVSDTALLTVNPYPLSPKPPKSLRIQ